MNHLGELSDKLKERMSSQSQEVEQIASSALKDLSGNLLKFAESELNSITADMDGHIQKLRKKQSAISASYWKQNILANLISALLLLIVAVCITGFYGWRIKESHEELTRINAQIEDQRKNVSKFTKWGIEAHQDKNYQYLAFPKGTLLEIRETQSGQPAVLLRR